LLGDAERVVDLDTKVTDGISVWISPPTAAEWPRRFGEQVSRGRLLVALHATPRWSAPLM